MRVCVLITGHRLYPVIIGASLDETIVHDNIVGRYDFSYCNFLEAIRMGATEALECVLEGHVVIIWHQDISHALTLCEVEVYGGMLDAL